MTARGSSSQAGLAALRAGAAHSPTPTAAQYVVAERRPWTGNPAWVFGDEWNHWCDTLDDARDVAAQWRTHPGTDPDDVAVFAVVQVDAAGGR
ncbi:MAG: hypothetical protein ACRDJC_18350 [Thermomicrobiales bacterium]